MRESFDRRVVPDAVLTAVAVLVGVGVLVAHADVTWLGVAAAAVTMALSAAVALRAGSRVGAVLCVMVGAMLAAGTMAMAQITVAVRLAVAVGFVVVVAPLVLAPRAMRVHPEIDSDASARLMVGGWLATVGAGALLDPRAVWLSNEAVVALALGMALAGVGALGVLARVRSPWRWMFWAPPARPTLAPYRDAEPVPVVRGARGRLHVTVLTAWLAVAGASVVVPRMMDRGVRPTRWERVTAIRPLPHQERRSDQPPIESYSYDLRIGTGAYDCGQHRCPDHVIKLNRDGRWICRGPSANHGRERGSVVAGRIRSDDAADVFSWMYGELGRQGTWQDGDQFAWGDFYTVPYADGVVDIGKSGTTTRVAHQYIDAAIAAWTVVAQHLPPECRFLD